jgi:hypothetical protein
MELEKTNPICSFRVLRAADCVWIPAFAGMTDKKISVLIGVNPCQKNGVEKTNPICSFRVLRAADCVWIPAFAGMTKKFQCKSV